MTASIGEPPPAPAAPYGYQRTSAISATAFFALPLIAGVAGRLLKGKPIYNGLEFETIVCAGRRGAEHLTMYPSPGEFGCPDLGASASYVYLPWLADLSHAVEGAVGLPVLLTLYAILNLSSIGFAVWLAIYSSRVPGQPLDRAPFLALLTGSILAWGNIAGVAYGLLAAAALAAPRRAWLFVAVVVLLGSIKQSWLSALVVVCMLSRPVWRRCLLLGVGLATGLCPVLWFVVASPDEGRAWFDVLSYFALVDRPGQGFFGWFFLVGDAQSGFAMILAWAGFSLLVLGAAVWLCEHGGLGANERVWVGLAAACLINPRLVAYEFLLLAPGMTVIIKAAAARGRRWPRWVVRGSLVFCVVGHLADLGDYAMMPVTLACSVALVATGLSHRFASRRAGPRERALVPTFHSPAP